MTATTSWWRVALLTNSAPDRTTTDVKVAHQWMAKFHDRSYRLECFAVEGESWFALYLLPAEWKESE